MSKLNAAGSYRNKKEDEDSDDEDKNHKDFNKKRSGDSDLEEDKDEEVEGEGKDEVPDEIVEEVALKFGLQNLGYSFDSARVDYMYHVTRSQNSLESIQKHGFDSYHADHVDYDGALARSDAPQGVFFLTTVYKGTLPTLTAYPRPPVGVRGKKYPRIALRIGTLKLSDYELFMVKELSVPPHVVTNPTKHLHIAFIHKTRGEALAWARIHLQWLDPLNNPLFIFDKDWYQLKKEQGSVDIWTNVFLVSATGDRLEVPLQTAEYAHVKHV